MLNKNYLENLNLPATTQQQNATHLKYRQLQFV